MHLPVPGVRVARVAAGWAHTAFLTELGEVRRRAEEGVGFQCRLFFARGAGGRRLGAHRVLDRAGGGKKKRKMSGF